jgi:predicted metal-dependent hydrolase
MPPALPERAPAQVEIDGEQIDVRVRESPTARTARLRVGPQHPLELIVPAAMQVDEIETVLVERQQWIADKLAQSRALADRRDLELDRPGVAWLAGEAIPIEVTGAQRAVARLVERPENGGGPTRVLLVGGTDDAAAKRAIERWYRRTARARLRAVVDEEAARLGLAVASVTVRDQRTRWGSCSAAGRLAFNWRLVMVPAEVLRYVAVHELLHLREPNHSRRFWRSLDEALPGWRSQAAWLRKNGGELRHHESALGGN